MIVIDTNIVSELMKPRPDQGMRQWINAQALETLYLTSVSWFELLHGLELMPEGRRQIGLREVLHKLRNDFFAQRMLSFGEEAASLLSKQMAQAKRVGVSISLGDGQIAAIALEHGFVVATRDTELFLAAGVKVIDPWELA
jgi:toxin FitB